MSNFLPWSAYIKIASLRSTVMKCNHLSSSLHTGPRCVATHSEFVDAAPFVILRHGEFPTWGKEKAGELLDRGWRLVEGEAYDGICIQLPFSTILYSDGIVYTSIPSNLLVNRSNSNMIP